MPSPYADVLAFSDFRKFLAVYLRERGKKEKHFTQSFICRKLGLPNSRSFFGDVLRGQKPLTASKTESLIGILELSEDEGNYFRTLVLFNQSGIPSEKAFYLDQLISLNRTPAFQMSKPSFEYYREWQHGTIRALLDIMDIKQDPEPLARAIFPALSLKKVRESISLLKKLGLIQLNESGYWKPSEKAVHSGTYLQDEIVKKYQAECMDVAKSAILRQDTCAQNISTETVSISEKGYRRIEQKLQQFKSDIRAIVHSDGDKADRVYQMNIQLFPQSK